MVPLRRALVVKTDLPFPEGIAVAAVLTTTVGNTTTQTKHQGVSSIWLAIGALIAGLIKFSQLALNVVRDTIDGIISLGRYRIFGTENEGYLYGGMTASPALLGVGWIIGPRIASYVLVGGLIGWIIIAPLIVLTSGLPLTLPEFAELGTLIGGFYTIWATQVRYIGVGAMLVGGLWSLWTLRGSLLSGLKSGLGRHDAGAEAVPHTERDLPMGLILNGIALFVLPLFALYYVVVDSFGVALAMAIIMVVAGFVFSSVSGYMAGLVGSSNNPVSGITISTILFASLILLGMLGRGSTVGPVAAIMIGAVICNAAAIAGDNLQDLKAGQLVGATPWRQQVMLAIGAVSSAAVMAPVLNLLLEAYGIGTPAREGVTALAAPQATLMASVAKGIFIGGLPWAMIAIGALAGVIVIFIDEYLRRSGSAWRAPILAVAVGIYLPLELSTPIFAGGLLAHFVERWHRRAGDNFDPEKLDQTGLLFSAGLIAGEAIFGVLLAIPIVLSGDAEVLAVGESLRPGQWAGVVALAGVALWMHHTATRGARRA
jgi:putative OPT family oligopeptide transporter